MTTCSRCPNPALVHCNCTTPPTPICIRCHPEHIATHKQKEKPSAPPAQLQRVVEDVKAVTRNQLQSCSTEDCEQEPVHVCILCRIYACEVHSKEHAAQCEATNMFPIDATIHLSSKLGLQKINRWKLYNKAIALLQDRMSQFEASVLGAIDQKFKEALAQLEEQRAMILDSVNIQLLSCRKDIDRVIHSIEALKSVERFQPANGVQQFLTSGNESSIIEALQQCPLGSFQMDCELLATSLPSPLYKLQWDEFGVLSDIQKPCEWAYQLVLLPESPSKLYNLRNRVKSQSGIDLSPPFGISMLNLPTGEMIICGGNLDRKVFLISNDFQRIDNVGEITSMRHYPGMCLYHGRVFIFGGRLGFIGGKDDAIHQYSCNAKAVSLLPLKMNQCRYAFWPCVVSGLIYIAGGYAPKIEVFNPIQMTVTALPYFFEGASFAVLVPLGDEEIVICCDQMFNFNPKAHEAPALIDDRFRQYFSPMAPFKCSDLFYFFELDFETQKLKLLSLSAAAHILEVTECLMPNVDWLDSLERNS